MTNEPEHVAGAGGEGDDIDPFLWDGSGTSDPAVVKLEEALAAARWDRSKAGRAVAPAAVRARGVGWRSGLALAASVAVIAGGAWVLWPVGETGWKVEPLAGAPGLDGRTLASISAVRAGDWLRTDGQSRAMLRGEGVGTVTVESGSDLRLLKASEGEHRLELARGSISAFVTTPPKVFFVNTPAATAVDMGCAYKLNVDEAGEGVLYVTLGWVELHEDEREVRVPAGAACRIGAKAGPNPGPRTPWFEDAQPDFTKALRAVDAGEGGMDELLAAARARDSLTLWHLAASVRPSEKSKVSRRLAELVPPPAGVDAVNPDAAGLEKWWGAVRASW